MYINVVYKDAPELSTTLRRPSTEPDPSQEKTLLVNPICPVRIMLEYIRKQCKLGSFTSFDLCDDSGCLLGLFSLDTYAYATDRFEHKRTYYVIVLKTESDRRLSVLPQLNQENRFYLDLKERVKTFLSTHPSPCGSKESDRCLSVLPQLNQANRFYLKLKERVKTFLSTPPPPPPCGSKNSVLKGVKSTPSAATPSPPPARSKSMALKKK